MADTPTLPPSGTQDPARLAALLSAVGDGLCAMDRAGRLVFMNRQAEQLLGWSHEEATGERLLELIRPRGETSRMFASSTTRSGGQGAIDVLRNDDALFRRRDGTTIPVAFSLNPIQEQGELTGAVLVFRDISETKAMLVALERARSQAEAGDRSKTRFMTAVTHELRTPIHGVLGMADLLRDTPLSDLQRDYLDSLVGTGQALLAIVDDILDVTTLESGGLQLSTSEFHLRELLHEAFARPAAVAFGKGLEFVVDVAPDVPGHLEGDAERLSQIIGQLAGNAARFTEEGQVVCKVTARQTGDEEVQLRLDVTDTGPGIAAEDHRRIFQLFTQRDEGLGRAHGGAGLGLVLCRRLARLMGGTVDLESEPGYGSCFTLRVPLRLGCQARVATLTAERALLRGARVLVVEDHEATREALARALEAAGTSCMEVSGAPQALNLLRRAQGEGRPFRLAVVDEGLPGTRGSSLAAMLRERAELQPLGLVLLAAPGDEGPRPGCDVVRAKPALGDDLVLDLAGAMQATGSEAVDPPGQDLPAEGGDPARVLVVEDNPVNQVVTRKILESLGHQVEVAVDGLQGYEAVLAGDFDAVLMDCQMPELDGLESTRRIRLSEPPGTHIPIIALTANSTAEDRRRCMDAGMDDFLAKPVRPEQLGRTLARWIGSGRER